MKLIKSLKLHWKIRKIPACWAFRLCGVKVPKSLEWIIGANEWRIPSDDDWKDLEMHLGMSQAEADDTSWRGTDEGSKLAGEYDLWDAGDLRSDANFDDSGFSALPGRTIDTSGTSYAVGPKTDFWSSSVGTSTTAWRRYLNHDYSGVYRLTYDKANGFSARCLRDTTTSEDSDADGTIYTDDYTGNDGTKYDGIKLGDQVWITENLKETKYADGTTITLATESSEWSDTEERRGTASDYTADVDTYGYLYNWFAIDNAKDIIAPQTTANTTNFFNFF